MLFWLILAFVVFFLAWRVNSMLERINQCPVCGYHFPWRERRKFTRGLCSRREHACPHCQSVLIREKKAWAMINAGNALTIPLYIDMLIHKNKVPSTLMFSIIALAFAGIALIYWGMARISYEVVRRGEVGPEGGISQE